MARSGGPFLWLGQMVDRRIGVTLVADDSNLRAGLSRASSAAQEFARESERNFGRAAGAATSVSQAAVDVAQGTAQVEMATRTHSAAAERFVRDLERQVAMLGKTRAEMMEMRAAELGVSQQATPLINRLHGATSAVDDMGISAGQTAMAMRQLPMQFTDIATSIAGGMPLYMIAIQQGGQIRDSFGGIGNALRGIGRLITPFTVGMAAAGGAVVALGASLYQGRQQMSELENALIVTTGRAGEAAREYAEAASRVGSATGEFGSAREAVQALASSTQFAGTEIEGSLGDVVSYMQLTGASAEEAVETLEKMRESPVEAIDELSERYGFFSAEIRRQAAALEDQGRTMDAFALTQREWAGEVEDRLGEVRANVGYLESAWETLGSKAAAAWDFMRGLGRESSTEDLQAERDRLAAEVAQIDASTAGFETEGGAVMFPGRRRDALDRRAQLVEEWIALADELRERDEQAVEEEAARQAQRERQTGVHAEKMLETQAAAFATREERRKKEVAQAEAWAEQAGWSEEKLATHIAQINAKYASSTKKQLTDAQRAMEQFELQREQSLLALFEETVALEREADQLERQNELYGMSAAAIYDLTAARLEDKLEVQQAMGFGEQQIELTERQIEANRRLAEGMREQEMRARTERAAQQMAREHERAAQEALREWERVGDQIGQSLTDAIFEGGKSGKELLEDLFRTMVIRPIVQPVINEGVSMFMPGQTASAQAGGGMGGISGISNLWSGLTSHSIGYGIQDFAAMASGIPGGVGPVPAGGQGVTGLFSNAGNYSNAAYGIAGALGGIGADLIFQGEGQSGMGGSFGATAGMAIGGPPGALIGALLGGGLGSLIGGWDGETRYGAGYMIDPATGRARHTGGPSGGDPNGAAAVAAITGVWDTTTRLAEMLGGSTAGLSFGAGSELSPEKGNSFVWSSWGETPEDVSHITGMRELGGVKDGQVVAAEFALELQRATIRGLQMANVDEHFAEWLGDIDVDELDAAGLQRVTEMVAALGQLQTAAGQMGMEQLANASATAQAKIIELSGGIDALSANLSTYYQEFYSETERAENLTALLTQRFREMGHELPDTREAYRQLVEAQDLSTDAGQEAYTTLVALSGTFAQLVDAADGAHASLEDVTRQFREYDQAVWQSAVDSARTAMDVLSDSIAAERSAAQDVHDAAMAGYQAELQEVQAAMSDLAGLSNSLASGLQAMRLQNAAYEQLRFAGAQQQVHKALAVARTGGSLRGLDLSPALSEIGRLDTKLYATWEDYAEDWMRTANEVAELQELTDAQLSIEERIADSIERQMERAAREHDQAMAKLDELEAEMQAQLDALLGISDGVMPLPAALLAMTQALTALGATPRPTDDPASLPTPDSLVAGWYSGTLGRAGDTQGVAYWEQEVIRVGAEAAYEAFRHSAFLAGEVPRFARGGVASGWSIVGELGPELVNFTDPARVYPADQTARMLAPAVNDWVGLTTGPMERLINGLMQRIDVLTHEVTNLRAEAQATAVRTASIDKILRRVQTEGGNALRIEEAA